MDYDSDSELRATDTLRFDSDSEDENLAIRNPVQENTSGQTDQPVSITGPDASDPSIAQKVQTDEANENEGLLSPGKRNSRSRVSKILDSDSEDDRIPGSTMAECSKEDVDSRNVHMHRLKSLLDSDSEPSLELVNKQSGKKKLKKKKSKNRPDSSEKTVDSDDEQVDLKEKQTNKGGSKLKSKKRNGMKKATSPVATAKDLLAELNLFFDDDDDEVETSHKPSAELNSHSENDSDLGGSRSRRSPVQRMTEKQAMEERQIIQSESQRMAREAYIDVPYHRSKTYSLQEFLARKTIRKPDPSRDCLAKESDQSIRMTSEQLEMFAKQLKERELESQEFFKSESESSDEDSKTANAVPLVAAREKEILDIIPSETDTGYAAKLDTHEEVTPIAPDTADNDNIDDGTDAPSAEHIKDQIDNIVEESSENMEKLFKNFQNPEPNESIGSTGDEVNYDFITTTQNDTISTKKASLIVKLNLPPCPRLSGHSDMVIDLDSGTLAPTEPSGADILFQRLAKCSSSVRKSAPAKSTLTILSTDDGVVKFNQISLLTEEERPHGGHKEPTPGAAYVKLKNALKERIDNDRREAMRKREEEYAKKKEIEKEEMGYVTDEDVEELLQDEECIDDEDERKIDVAGQQKNFFNDEAECDENDDEADDEHNEGNDASESSSSSDDEDDQCDAESGENTGKRKGRIVKAFEDSDDENIEDPIRDTVETKTPEKLAQFENNKLNPDLSGKGKEDNIENMLLPWKQGAEEQSPGDDLMELCSGRFVTQFPTESIATLTQTGSSEINLKETILDAEGTEIRSGSKPLYTQTEHFIEDSQLMELCSGRFETQLPVAEKQTTENGIGNEKSAQDEESCVSGNALIGGRLLLDSSEDEADSDDKTVRNKGKKRKRKLQLSDDEDETANHESFAQDSALDQSDNEELEDDQIVTQNREADEEDEGREEEEEEDLPRYVDYDSEENEVEVKLTKLKKQQMLASFVENEAELSESEWGSADEDEKGLDQYDGDLADEEQFDQRQLQQELEKIHNRQMLDQDNRELEHLKEIFIEDEENDGVGRVRQFRWKNVEKTFSLDYDQQNEGINENEEGADGDASDDESELAWRKMRHERNKLLKEQNVDHNVTELVATTFLNPEDTIETPQAQENNQSVASANAMKKKITIVKKATTASSGKEDSPFLISKSTILQGHKASFLSRDAETLNKLANLVKSNPDTDGTSTVVAAKSRNFLFTTLSPAVEKASKRSLDPEEAVEQVNIKRSKTAAGESSIKKRLMLGSLM